MADLVTTPCKGCGKPIVFVAAVDANGNHVQVPLDPAAPVYLQQSDGEGGTVWTRERSAMVSHFATCSQANQFSGSSRNRRGE